MTATAAAAPDTSIQSRDRVVIATLLVATFVVILNETIMGVALPRLMEDLGVGPSLGQWLTTAFMLTMAVVIPTTGFLLQRLSTRTVFATAMGLFSAGTLLATVAPGFWILLLARVIQASGTAIMLPLLMTTILTLVPVQRRGVVMGNVSIVISVAPAIGPTISGIIIQFFSWRFMFGIVFPIAVLALVVGLRTLQNIGERGSQPIDIVSVLLTVPAFGGIVFGLSRLGEGGGEAPWLAPVALVTAVICLVIFLRRQRKLESGSGPLLDLRAFRYPMFRLSLALLCLAMAALFSLIILLPLYLQNIRGLGSLQTGLLLLPGGLLMGLLGPVVGRLFDRFGPRVLTVPGACGLVLCTFGFSRAEADTPVIMLLGLHVLFSAGLAFLLTPSFTTGLNPLPPSLYSHGSAILTTLQQVSGAAGTALLVTVLALRSSGLEAAGMPAEEAELAGLQAAFLVATGIASIAIVLAMFMQKTEAAPHPQPAEAPSPAP
jgi:MFS transporter, DHA2 family, lincomycin resistance protein